MTDQHARQLHDAAWPDMFENLQTAYGELSRAQFELERRAGEIDETRALFERVIQSMSDALFLLDPSGRVVQTNRAASELLGLPLDQIVGRTFREVCRNDLVPNTPWQLLENHPDGMLRNLDIDVWHQSGRAVPVSVSCSLVRDPRGKITGVLAVGRDIAERKRAEERIQALNAELEQRVRDRTHALEESNRELEAFSYSVSHDLRAPLRHVQGYVEMLKRSTEGQLSEKALRYLHTIADASRNMGVLIDNLLSFSRMSRSEMRQGFVDVDALVRECIDGLEPSVRGRQVVWTLSPLPSVYGDRPMLKQVFVNLLENALKYTRPRDPAEIEVGIGGAEDGYRIFFVRDNGVGFDPAYGHKLFGVFQRLHSTEEFEGTGIGLANVRRIIGRHGGRTWAEGRPDKGAAIYFTLRPATAPYGNGSSS
jgi:PAS domain S-box-containing protein